MSPESKELVEDFTYQLRNRVYYLGTITVHFHKTSEVVDCICSRVLLKIRISNSTHRRSSENQHFAELKTEVVPGDLKPKVDFISFSIDRIAHPECMAAKRSDSEIIGDLGAANSAVVNSDENHLIGSDTDDETTSCCCFGKICRSIRKKLRRKRKMPAEEKNDDEPSTSNYKRLTEPEHLVGNGIAPYLRVDVNVEEDDGPLEFSSKRPENGITHMGYAFQEPKVTDISRITWDYNTQCLNQWNKSLTLQINRVGPYLDTSNGFSNTADHAVPDALPDIDNFAIPEEPPINFASFNFAIPEEPPINFASFDPQDVLGVLRGTSNAGKNGKRKRKKKNGLTKAISCDIRHDPSMRKYWNNRFRLFSMFDSGILLDKESWYSVTPEKISKHIADRCRCDTIIDGFCGAGGNTIQFAFTCERVIAIDIDPNKILLAKHNAKIYGVADRIEFIVGDFFKVVPTMKADVVFLSPPWGGPAYNRRKSFALHEICPPYGGKSIFDVARGVCEDIAYYLPRNINTCDLLTLSKPNPLELEQNFLGTKLVAITAYFGELVIDERTPAEDL